MAALADYFEVSIDSLMMKGPKESGPPLKEQILAYTEGEPDQPENLPESPPPRPTDDEAELLHMFRLLPPKEQARLLGRVEALAERYR